MEVFKTTNAASLQPLNNAAKGRGFPHLWLPYYICHGGGRKHPLLEEQDSSHRNHVIRILGHEEGHIIRENYRGIFWSLKCLMDPRATGTCRELYDPENQRGPMTRGLIHTAEQSPHCCPAGKLHQTCVWLGLFHTGRARTEKAVLELRPPGCPAALYPDGTEELRIMASSLQLQNSCIFLFSRTLTQNH